MHKSTLDAGRRGFSGCAVCILPGVFQSEEAFMSLRSFFMEQAGQPEHI